MSPAPVVTTPQWPEIGHDERDVFDVLSILLPRWRLLLGLPLLAMVLAGAATFLLTPIFTAKTSFLPPQQQQGGGAGAALASGTPRSVAFGFSSMCAAFFASGGRNNSTRVKKRS